MKPTLIAAVLALASMPALAAEPPKPDPVQQALGQMVGECQNREAQTLAKFYAVQAQLEAEKARADAAEARLSAQGQPKATESTAK